MFFLKPNIDKLKKNTNFKGLVKALSNKDSAIQYNAINAIIDLNGAERKDSLLVALKHHNGLVRSNAARALSDYKSKAVVNGLLAAINNTPFAIETLVKLEDLSAIDPIVEKFAESNYLLATNEYFTLIRKFGRSNKLIKKIALGLGYPEKYAKKRITYDGKSVDEVIKKLPSTMSRIPVLKKEQVMDEYEILRGIVDFSPRGLHGGEYAESTKVIKNQLNADKNYLSRPKTSFVIWSVGWDAYIYTNYTRGSVVISFKIKLWRSLTDDGKKMYYYCFGERNW